MSSMIRRSKSFLRDKRYRRAMSNAASGRLQQGSESLIERMQKEGIISAPNATGARDSPCPEQGWRRAPGGPIAAALFMNVSRVHGHARPRRSWCRDREGVGL